MILQLKTNFYFQNQPVMETNNIDSNIIYQETPNSKINTVSNFECDVCKKKFTTHERVKRYIIRHINVMKLTEYIYCCSICGKKFTRQCYLNKHKKIHFKLKNKIENKFKCTFCHLTFGQKKFQSQHKKVCIF